MSFLRYNNYNKDIILSDSTLERVPRVALSVQANLSFNRRESALRKTSDENGWLDAVSSSMSNAVSSKMSNAVSSKMSNAVSS